MSGSNNRRRSNTAFETHSFDGVRETRKREREKERGRERERREITFLISCTFSQKQMWVSCYSTKRILLFLFHFLNESPYFAGILSLVIFVGPRVCFRSETRAGKDMNGEYLDASSLMISLSFRDTA